MSRDPEDVNKLTESTYKTVVEQFNPGLRNLVNLGKSYEKTVTAMTLAGKAYFDAVSKIGESAAVSPVSRELGVVLMEISEVHKNVQQEMEDTFRKFHKELIAELERKTDMDVKYMTATFKRYQSEHKLKQDSLDKSKSDLKKLRRKSQGKHSTKYEIKENEYLETLTSRQTEMQRFIAEGCREALLEEKRRFCFLVDKHCTFSYQVAGYHEKVKEMLTVKLPSWEDKCTDATNVPDSVLSMIESLHTPVATTPITSPILEHGERNNLDSVVPPPAPTLKAQISPLANMFNQDIPRSPISLDQYSDQESYEGNSLSRSASMCSKSSVVKKHRVQTIFPHTAGNNETLLSFDDGDLILLLMQEEKDGWLYGELETTGQRGWFPSSYCRPYSEPVVSDKDETLEYGLSVAELPELTPQEEQEEEVGEEEVGEPMLLPPPDYSDASSDGPTQPSTSSPQHTVLNGISKPSFLGAGNPFATVKLRPTVTNDRSAPVI